MTVKTSVKYAHIIDLSSHNSGIKEGRHDVKVWDAVVTMLYMISKQTVSEFLNYSVRTFSWSNHSKRAGLK
jgi:hypothetical protein